MVLFSEEWSLLMVSASIYWEAQVGADQQTGMKKGRDLAVAAMFSLVF